MIYCSVKLSSQMHDSLIKRVLNAPMNLYFDQTPIGSLVNIFSKDLHACDINTMRAVVRFFKTIVDIACKVILAVLVIPQLVVILIINFFMAFKLVSHIQPALVKTTDL
jgi:ABC-type multidrug transport system fused ATPase/permease subunit